MKLNIKYLMIIVVVIIAAALTLTLIANNQTQNLLKTEGVTANVTVIDKHSYRVKNAHNKMRERLYTLTVQLPNGETAKVYTNASTHETTTVGESTILVCYANDIAEINYPDCAN